MGPMKGPVKAAGCVVFRRTPRGPRYLILRAFKNWDFPKGLVDTGEEQFACAKREVAEETGLTDLDYPFGDGFRETVPYAANKVARYYLCLLYTSDAADERSSVDLGGRRIIKKKKNIVLK